MTEASTPHSSPPPEQLPWGIAYLREDIQDLRQDLRENIQGVRQEIQGVRQEIQEVRQEVRSEIQGVRQEIQEVRQEVRILRDRVDDRYELLLKRIDSRFAWTLTTVIAVAGVIVAAIKL